MFAAIIKQCVLVVDYSRLFSYKQLFSFRWKRSIPFSPNKERNYNKNKKKLRRSKREIPGNPCVMGQEKRTIIYSALDAETEEPMELLQDAGVITSFFILASAQKALKQC